MGQRRIIPVRVFAGWWGAVGAHLNVHFCDKNEDPRPDSSFALV